MQLDGVGVLQVNLEEVRHAQVDEVAFLRGCEWPARVG